MSSRSIEQLLQRIDELESQLAESDQIIEAIRTGEVDAFAINSNEVYTLQSGDYAYRVLIEDSSEGAVNLTEEGLIVYTNSSFAEILSLPYDKVIGSFFFNFIHPDSHADFIALFEQAITGRSKGEINLAVNDKIIPVYISLTSLQPKLPTLGMIITDLTGKKKNEEVIMKYQTDLEKKNYELIRTNSEIESFTYIASHDLQAPLRKIQGFSNRILEKDFETLSEVGKDYIQRIIGAVAQMQGLISALLKYSHASPSQIQFTSTNLNHVLEEVKNVLSETLKNTNAVIEASPLPTLNVIPHQLNQLFLNIISNALKYRKDGTTPVIKIIADIITAEEVPEEIFIRDDKFWRIDFADNGIGFDPKYEEKIFEIFQRLVSKTEYEGTGIGLAICKKIVLNHNGYIKATGRPGAGATFSIYLPVNGKLPAP